MFNIDKALEEHLKPIQSDIEAMLEKMYQKDVSPAMISLSLAVALDVSIDRLLEQLGLPPIEVDKMSQSAAARVSNIIADPENKVSLVPSIIYYRTVLSLQLTTLALIMENGDEAIDQFRKLIDENTVGDTKPTDA